MITADILRNIATRTEDASDYVLALVQRTIIDAAVDGKLKRTVSFNTCIFKDRSNLATVASDAVDILTDSGYKVDTRISVEKHDEYLSFDISWKD